MPRGTPKFGAPVFERRHYEKVATVLKGMRTYVNNIEDVVDEFSVMFALDNSRFDPVRFEKATGRKFVEMPRNEEVSA